MALNGFWTEEDAAPRASARPPATFSPRSAPRQEQLLPLEEGDARQRLANGWPPGQELGLATSDPEAPPSAHFARKKLRGSAAPFSASQLANPSTVARPARHEAPARGQPISIQTVTRPLSSSSWLWHRSRSSARRATVTRTSRSQWMGGPGSTHVHFSSSPKPLRRRT